MKKPLLAILIVVMLFGALAACCNFSNGQLAHAAEADAGSAGYDSNFGLPKELDAKSFTDAYGEGLSFKADGRRVYLYVKTVENKLVGVQMRGTYFGVSGIEVLAEVYSCNELTIDFKINEKKANLTAKQLATRNILVELFSRMSQMIDDVDGCANTTYDGTNELGITSDVYRYNVAKQGETVEVSYYTYDMLNYARRMYEVTNGAFNPAVYRLVDLWGFSSRIYSNGNFGLPYDREVTAQQFWTNGYPLPEQKYVDAFSSSEFTDFSQQAVTLTASNGKYFVTKNVAPAEVDGVEFQQWIDLGGIAKGYAVDMAREMIAELGIDRFYVNAGNSSIAMGNEYDGNKTTLGMLDAFDSSAEIFQSALFSVDVGKSSVSTSGQNVRKYTVDGVEYAHILDGKTGAPAQTGVRSVMVVVPEEMGAFWATMGDCLTTALTVMGREKIVEFANGYLKENGVKIVVQFETLDGRKQLLSNFDKAELTGIAESFSEFGWALKADDDGNFYYDANAKFSNSKGTYTVLIAVLGSLLLAGAVALVVYHFVRGKKRVTANVVNAKKDKPFKVLDVLMYMCVTLLILVLFYVFIFDTDSTPMRAVTVIDDDTGEVLFVYNVKLNDYSVNNDNANGWHVVVNKVDDGLEVTLTREIQGETHFNTLKVTRGQNPSVKMIDSHCGFHQDCVRNFPAVTRSGGAIVCSPNRLKIITQ